MKNGTAIVRYPHPSHWKSCNIIEDEIHRLFPEAQVWIQNEDRKFPSDISTLIISDHRWLGQSELEDISRESEIRVEFYLYGDFTLRLKAFDEHMRAMRNHQVNLIVASESQKRLVSQIYSELRELIEVRPYPLDEKKFAMNSGQGQKFRTKYRLGTGRILGFAGRISRQKGVLELMSSFLKSQEDGTLVILGPLHSHPFWQFTDSEDLSFPIEFRKLLAIAGERIIWIPEVSHEEMPGFYSAIDCFISLSYFHDEDFNLTLSEALAAGKPAIVTAWGGHFRYAGDPRVNFVAMEVSGEHARPDLRSFELALKGTGSEVPQRALMTPLSQEKKEFIRNTKHFLKSNDGTFNRELYFSLYSSYL